jgi:DNA-binding NarL/FixJ family response regulator
VASVGVALLGHLEAKGCAKSHRETVESHLRVHLVPFFKGRSLDRITDDDVTRLVVRLLTAQSSPEAPAEEEPAAALLSRREREVLELVAHGLTDREIAEQLIVSPHTVHRHVANIRHKLGRESRTAAVAEASRLGLL